MTERAEQGEKREAQAGADASCPNDVALEPAAARPVFNSVESAAVDLHIHTTVSDGSATFQEVLAWAEQHGVARIAFTNHDTTRGLDEAVELGTSMGVHVIGGVEISAYDFARNRKVHVLGYGLRTNAPAIAALCEPTLAARRANSLWQLDQLRAAGYQVDVDHVMELAQASTCLYKQHIMEGLTDEPHDSAAYKTLYRRLFKNDGICDRDITYVDARDAVRAIATDGGVAVVAHPGQLDSYEFVPELAKCGLQGIEVYHHDHTPVDHVRCERLAKRFGLFVTAGSDFHGRFGDIPHIGYRIPADFRDTLPL